MSKGKKCRAMSVEETSKESPGRIAASTEELSPENAARIKILLERGAMVEDCGSSIARETLEELKALKEVIQATDDHCAFSLCEWCQKAYILGESIRGIHGADDDDDDDDEFGDNKLKSAKEVHNGKVAVLKYLNMVITAGEHALSAQKRFTAPKVDLPRIGLVKSLGKFESFPQQVVLWCSALSRDQAEKKVALIVKKKKSWLRTMVRRLNLEQLFTVEDVKKYLAGGARFLSTHLPPSDREIAFWLSVAGPEAKLGQPLDRDLKENLDVVVAQLGKRLTPSGPSMKKDKTDSSPGSDESLDKAETIVPKKKKPPFQSALSAILKNGGRSENEVIDENDPEKKMRMIFRKLGGADAPIPDGDWTTGINESLLAQQLEGIRTFVSGLGVTLLEAVKLLGSSKAPKSNQRGQRGRAKTPENVFWVPRYPPKPQDPN